MIQLLAYLHSCSIAINVDVISILFFCVAGIDEISVDVYKGVEHSDSEDSDKSDSSDSEYGSDEEQKTKDGQDEATKAEAPKEPTKSKVNDQPSSSQDKEGKADTLMAKESAAGDATATASDAPTKEKLSKDSDKESPEKSKAICASPGPREKSQVKEEAKQPVPVDDSDSERELVIDLGEEHGGKDRRRSRKDNTTVKEPSAGKSEGESCTFYPADPTRNNQTHTECNVNFSICVNIRNFALLNNLCFSPAGKALTPSTLPSQNSTAPSTPSSVSTQSPMAIPVTMVSFTTPSSATISLTTMSNASATPTSSSSSNSSSASATPALKKQRPLLPRETVPVVQRAVVWNPSAKFQTSSQKWHMQKMQRQQQNQQPVATTQMQASSPRQGQAQVLTQTQAAGNGSTAVSSSSAQQSSQSTRYQTRQAVKGRNQGSIKLHDSIKVLFFTLWGPVYIRIP